MSSIAIARLQKEVAMLHNDPPPGCWAAPIDDKLTQFQGQVQGPTGTVYEGGIFKLVIDIPARYPMEPPKVRFTTPVYHPNIDPEGRICLDILNPPPKGAWRPSLNISTVLASIGLLLSDPNPDDGLVTDTTDEFKHRRDVFDSKARDWTRRHAMQQEAAVNNAAEALASEVEKTDDGSVVQQQQQEQEKDVEDSVGGSGVAVSVDKKKSVECSAVKRPLGDSSNAPREEMEKEHGVRDGATNMMGGAASPVAAVAKKSKLSLRR